LVCEGSPKIQVLLQTIANVNIVDNKKMLSVASCLAQQVLIVAVLRALRINAAVYYAGLTVEEKHAIQKAFNLSPNPTIVVRTFLTLSHGGN
jgi:superfamily II DNA helicase RecQ